MTVMPPEQIRAKAYLNEKGTQAPIAQIRERVADAFAAVDALLDGVTPGQARVQPGGGEWSVHEVVDHLVETHPLALAGDHEISQVPWRPLSACHVVYPRRKRRPARWTNHRARAGQAGHRHHQAT